MNVLPQLEASNQVNSMRSPWPAFSCLSLILIIFSGCSSSSKHTVTGPQPPPPTQPPPIARQAGSVEIFPQYVALGLSQKQRFQATAVSGETLVWSVNGIAGGNAVVGTVDSYGNYTAPATLQSGSNIVVEVADVKTTSTNFATAIAAVLTPGVVASTANPQVATYSVYLPGPGSASIQFGETTDYGLKTWEQRTPTANGGQINIFVAGMRADSSYHMQARVTMDNGAEFSDGDRTFMTGTPPATAPVAITAGNGQQPQAGIELFDTLEPQEGAQVFATDLEGNVLWTYHSKDGSKFDTVQPVKMLSNGHFLVLVSFASSVPLQGITVPPNTVDAVREVDLAGNTIREITENQLSAALSAKGYQFNLSSLHHDVLALDNGHWILLASEYKSFSDLPGYPGATNVLGDLVIDVDPSGQPVWVWNSFDHLDVNRHPLLFPDWTHSNALLYSADDHNLLLSMRHQNWILKLDYADGQGSGRVLWRLGQGGDFKLERGADPIDWFYAQHGPNFFSPNTSGTFRLGIMDNGDARSLPDGSHCSATSTPSCFSEAVVFDLDEAAMTATLTTQYKLPSSLYSYFGGDVRLLENGDVEADFCASPGGSVIQELNFNDATPRLIWSVLTKGSAQYRTERLPSLYPGVQW
jgi:hypothetical protein